MSVLTSAIGEGAIAVLVIICTAVITMVFGVSALKVGNAVEKLLGRTRIAYDTQRNIACVAMLAALIILTGVVVAALSYMKMSLE